MRFVVFSDLGLAGYYKRFIEGFSKLAKPMIALLEKNAKFVWSEKCQANFEELKKRLTTTPVLVLPNLSKSFSIYCDASHQWPWMCSYARRKSSGLCISIIEKA